MPSTSTLVTSPVPPPAPRAPTVALAVSPVCLPSPLAPRPGPRTGSVELRVSAQTIPISESVHCVAVVCLGHRLRSSAGTGSRPRTVRMDAYDDPQPVGSLYVDHP